MFNTNWTVGSLEAIDWLVGPVGAIALFVISAGGFFMVVLPLIRNVINGIVCVAPGLCERIDEAHRTKLDMGLLKKEGNQISNGIGALTTGFLALWPNFIALSDFNDGIKDPKTFMIKAIPMMCVYVFIGVFIFKGYPAKFADKFSQAATQVIDLALNNTDPAALVEMIPTDWARPDFATENATDELGKNTNEFAAAMYKSFTGRYNEMTPENRTALSHQIEQYCNGMLSQILDYSDSKKYKMSVEVRTMSYEPEMNQKSVWPSPAHDEKEHIYIFQNKLQIEEMFDIGIPGGVSGEWTMYVLKFYEQADNDIDSTNINCNMTIPKNYIIDGNGKTCKVKLPTESVKCSDSITINGYSSTGVPNKITDDGKSWIVFTFECTKDKLVKSEDPIVRGVYAYAPDTKMQHTVKSIDFDGSKITFTPVDTATWTTWSEGESPARKNGTTVGNEDEKEKAED